MPELCAKYNHISNLLNTNVSDCYIWSVGEEHAYMFPLLSISFSVSNIGSRTYCSNDLDVAYLPLCRTITGDVQFSSTDGIGHVITLNEDAEYKLHITARTKGTTSHIMNVYFHSCDFSDMTAHFVASDIIKIDSQLIQTDKT